MNSIIENFEEYLDSINKNKPLIHHITNYVTVNDCANITLAIGASPVMADAIEEAQDFAAIASALVINIGTLNSRTIESMIGAGKNANSVGIPVIFDPVGAGATLFRNEATELILREVKISVLRGNISEIRYIAGLSANTKGVDASDFDSAEDAVQIATTLAKRYECIVAISGATDIVSNGRYTFSVTNGHSSMSRITGTGCMLASLVASFCGGNPKDLLGSTIAASLCMGVAGEIAFEKSGALGNASMRTTIIDEISKMNASTIKQRGIVNEIEQ